MSPWAPCCSAASPTADYQTDSESRRFERHIAPHRAIRAEWRQRLTFDAHLQAAGITGGEQQA